MNDLRDRLKPIIQPIVEGQIRDFINSHPGILVGVDWYKPRTDKARTLTNSLAKRIVSDLLCDETIARVEAAVLEPSLDAAPVEMELAPVREDGAIEQDDLERSTGSSETLTGNRWWGSFTLRRKL